MERSPFRRVKVIQKRSPGTIREKFELSQMAYMHKYWLSKDNAIDVQTTGGSDFNRCFSLIAFPTEVLIHPPFVLKL